MKKLYFLVFAFVGLFSAAVTVAAECPSDGRGSESPQSGGYFPGSEEQQRAYFLINRLIKGSCSPTEKALLDNTFDELYDLRDPENGKLLYRITAAEKYREKCDRDQKQKSEKRQGK